MDSEKVADPPAITSGIQLAADPLSMHITGDTPFPEPPSEPLLPTTAEERQATLTAFLIAPRLRNAAHMYLGDISLILYILLDTPGRRMALSCITPPIPSAKATGI
jgi:hypothetical protein